MLQRMVNRQYRFYAYMDVWIIYTALALIGLPFIFLMKKSVSRGGVSPH